MKRIILLSAFLLLSSTSKAWLLVEPFIGYNRGQNQANRTQGIGLGTRLGFEIKDIFIAGDMGYHETQQGALSSVKYTDTGITFGGKIRDYRIWYGLISSSIYKYKSGAADVTYTGSGSKYGLGVQISGSLYLNMELRILDFTQSETAGVVTPIAEIGTLGFLSMSWVL